MQICFQTRTVTLSIGEFSEFTDRPVSTARTAAGGGVWRAQVGQLWHTQMRQNLESENPEATFEVKIEAAWRHRNWTFQFQGRADQLLPNDSGITIREVKTTEYPLPAHDSDLRRHFPAWFLQLEAYRQLYPLMPGNKETAVAAELVFVEFQTGMIQTVPLGADLAEAFDQQLERIYAFVERRRDHLERLREFSFRPPFPSPRPGQETIREEMEATFANRKIGFFEAPTGFGKTGVALEFALNQLQTGKITRVLFLTSKATGQIQAANQLRQMLEGQPTVSFLQVRNKGEHCINTEFHCFREVCPFLDNLEERWDQSGLARLFAESGIRIDLDFLRRQGQSARICPYELTRATLPHLDVWIGDYNYAFSPANRGLFFNQPGFDARETLLIVDEAHNLPGRVCDAFSARALLTSALAVMTQLELLGVRPSLLLAWQSWLDFLSHLDGCEELPATLEIKLREIVARICDQLGASPLDYPRLGPDITEQLMDMFSIRQLLESDQLKRLLWSPEPGVLNLSCIDAGPFIAETLRSFRQSILMSGTLGPVAAFREACQLNEEETATLEAVAPWRKAACDVAVDVRVDTRFRSRARSYVTTAATVASLVEVSPAPVAVFFPSYRYAEEICRRLDEEFPWVRVAVQEKGLDFQGQSAFVEENLLLSDALFLILGSSYAESIDQLGGKIAHAMVVGPALPEVNSLQKARIKNLGHLSQEEAFHAVYQIPGMQRVNQALGRLVRAPGQRTRILLHCQRFAEKSFSNLLHADHQPRTFIFNADELDQWLKAETLAADDRREEQPRP